MSAAETKRFRLGEFIKDGHLAAAVRNELTGLEPEQLALAQEAVIEIATSGRPGTFEQLVDAYRQAIARVLHPERKLVKDPHVDRNIIKNPQLAAHLDKELVDVTADEIAAVNKALRYMVDEARGLAIETADANGVRWTTHSASEICGQDGRHPVIPVEDRSPCGYFRPPEEWREIYRLAVRKALKR